MTRFSPKYILFLKENFEGKTLNQKRNELVVKSNDLIRKSRYELSEREQKIIIYIISLIDINDTTLKRVNIRVKDFCDICGITSQTKNRKDIYNTIQNLSDKSKWIKFENEEVLFRWIDTVSIKRGIISVKLSESLSPYIIALKENFTKYELINVLALHSKYSIRLYEIFKSYLWIGSFDISLDKLKEIINCNYYKLYKDFNKNVLKRTVKEINDYTDLLISYSTIKEGKKVIGLTFKVKEKEGFQMSIDMIMRRQERLDSNEK